MKPLFIFLTLCITYLARATFLHHEGIHGLSESLSILTNTSIFIGIYISLLSLIICWNGDLKIRYIVVAFIIAVGVKDLSVFKYIVYGYEYVFKGALPLRPSDDYISTMHNSYITMMWTCLSVSLVCIRFNPNPVRKIVAAPLLVMFLGFNFYHFYQYLLINAPTWESSRENAIALIDPIIQTEKFSDYCSKVDGMECFEFYVGDPIPEGMVYPASIIMNDFMYKYELGNLDGFISTYSVERGNYLKLHFNDGQVDHTFAPAFWASINMFIDFESGLIRVAEYDHIGMVHQGCVAAVIALSVASLLWMSGAILLCSFHPSRLGVADPRWLRVICLGLLLSFFVLDYAPLHYSYGFMFLGVVILFFFNRLPSLQITRDIFFVILPHVFFIGLIVLGLNPEALSVIIGLMIIILLTGWASLIGEENGARAAFAKVILLTGFIPAIASLGSIQFLGIGVAKSVGLLITGVSLMMILCVAWDLIVSLRDRCLTGDKSILLLSGMVIWVLNFIYSYLVNPFSYNYLKNQSEKPFNQGVFELRFLEINVVTFYALAVFTVGVFLMFLYKYLNKSHSRFQR